MKDYLGEGKAVTRFKRIIIALAAMIGLTGGVVAVAEVPAFASWHGTCPSYHDGDMCAYAATEGGSFQWVFPQASYTLGQCVDLVGITGVDDWTSVEINWTDYYISAYVDADCPSNELALDIFDIPAGGAYSRYDLNSYAAGQYDNNISSFVVRLLPA
jgi:hypothetical protein